MKEHLRCPSCQRKLFEIEFDGVTDINIKCPKCKNIIHFKLSNGLRIAEVVGKGAK